MKNELKPHDTYVYSRPDLKIKTTDDLTGSLEILQRVYLSLPNSQNATRNKLTCRFIRQTESLRHDHSAENNNVTAVVDIFGSIVTEVELGIFAPILNFWVTSLQFVGKWVE
ncbi:unnamed protein product [Cercopithifilaria johnstoni]|uniref:Uncharacterized protein n=1 Tax=Cercopithifilaria johnstoni TaxID=2874296 RepID=A0A8J2QB34_9BILA|nr:unnamed protein product [Cercopithifilaria johnstoni]